MCSKNEIMRFATMLALDQNMCTAQQALPSEAGRQQVSHVHRVVAMYSHDHRRDFCGELGSAAYHHRPHFNHGPLCFAILFAGMRLCMAMAFQLQMKHCIVRLVISSLGFCLATCDTALVTQTPQAALQHVSVQHSAFCGEYRCSACHSKHDSKGAAAEAQHFWKTT